MIYFTNIVFTFCIVCCYQILFMHQTWLPITFWEFPSSNDTHTCAFKQICWSYLVNGQTISVCEIDVFTNGLAYLLYSNYIEPNATALVAEWPLQAYQEMVDMVTLAEMLIQQENITLRNVTILMELTHEFYPKIYTFSAMKLLKKSMGKLMIIPKYFIPFNPILMLIL